MKIVTKKFKLLSLVVTRKQSFYVETVASLVGARVCHILSIVITHSLYTGYLRYSITLSGIPITRYRVTTFHGVKSCRNIITIYY